MTIPSTKTPLPEVMNKLLWTVGVIGTAPYIVAYSFDLIVIAYWLVTFVSTAAAFKRAIKNGRKVRQIMPTNYGFKITRVGLSTCGRYTVASGINCAGEPIKIAIPDAAQCIEECLVEGELLINKTPEEISQYTQGCIKTACPAVYGNG